MWEYKNGNYIVKILDNGTKIRLSNNPIPEFPESIDVKITNKCNGGCKFCYENSNPNGGKFNVDFAYKLFRDLPEGIELAIGGGNPLECKQDLIWLKRKLSYHRLIFNITVNAQHLDNIENIDFTALGISYRKDYHNKIKQIFKDYNWYQKVIHLIIGIHTINNIKTGLKDFDRILLLGYKKIGRGKEYYSKNVQKNINNLKNNIGLENLEFHKCGKIIAFDNLALEQLELKKYFTPTRWREIYMGNDGEFTMYLDLVKNKYAKSSTSKIQYDIKNLTIKKMFQNLRNKILISKIGKIIHILN